MQKEARLNNFDFLRIVAILLVLISHQFALTKRIEPGLLSFQSMGGIGVLIFFSISGYLVAQSWDRDPSAWRFLARRVIRIWPGLIMVTFVAACVLGPLATSLPLRAYFHAPEFRGYFVTLEMSIRFDLPGVFKDNPWGSAVNGSLWTLPLEVRWYVILLLLGLVGVLRQRFLVLLGAVAFAIFVFGVRDAQHSTDRSLLNEFGAFFCYGVCLNYFNDIWTRRPALIAALLVIIGLGLAKMGYQYAAFFAIFPFAVIWIGTSSTPIVRRFGRFGDLSYGMYIYAFPVQQTVIWLTGNRLSIIQGLIVSVICTAILAFISWHLVEHRGLALKRFIRKPARQQRTALA